MLNGVYATLQSPKFRSIQEAMDEAGILYSSNPDLSILIWNDSLADVNYFSNLKPWQIINRIPNINVLCRKFPFSCLLQKISNFFPDLFSFFPKTFLLPNQNQELQDEIDTCEKTYIVKPDGGSLGSGIIFLEPKTSFSPQKNLAIAQEYIDSYLIDNKKFDLRIYALVASIHPLSIYVYHGGLARFCAEEAGGNSRFSKITNVTMNKKAAFMEISKISRMLTEVFEIIRRTGVDIDELWRKIEDAIGLTIVSSYNYISHGQRWFCKPCGYPRCFQILGFDILLDKQLNPHVLEVNYRPSLDYFRGVERRMKVTMIREALEIVAPLQDIQTVLLNRQWAWDELTWESFIMNNPSLIENFNKGKRKALAKSSFVQVWPSDEPNREIWKDVIAKIKSFHIENIPGLHFPLSVPTSRSQNFETNPDNQGNENNDKSNENTNISNENIK